MANVVTTRVAINNNLFIVVLGLFGNGRILDIFGDQEKKDDQKKKKEKQGGE
tara:strand:+ start:618 stop:773 length:156 start_codon:yes stop_codon:yes gene_type:complete